MANSAGVIGIHPDSASELVHLVELEILDDPEDYSFNEITQVDSKKPCCSWKLAFQEQHPAGNRVAFNFHNLDTTNSFLSPTGSLS